MNINIVFIILGLVDAFAVRIFIQNNKVYHYRQKMLQYIYHRNLKDINEGRYDYKWRNDAYDNVSYNEMLFKFWRPFDSFFPERLIEEMKHAQL